MKAKTKVQVRTPAGLVEAPCYHQWKQEVAGMEFEFALHIAAGHTKGVVAPLAISELSTGFDVKAAIKHPVSRCTLTSANIQGLKSDEVKKVARAALHNLLYKKVGAGRFMQALLRAQMQLAKTGQEYVGHSDQLPPVLGGLTGRIPPKQESALNKLLGICEVCDGSKVVSTTDTDHEGNYIEITCPTCAPKSIQLPETPVGSMGGVGYRFDVSMTPGDPAAGAVIFTEDDLPSLRHQRDQLQILADQHGTMTGDTTEHDYEDVAERIADLNDQIEALEGKPCSN